MSKPEVAIEVKAVSKHFLLPHERKQSVKSVFTSLFKKGGIKTTERQQALKDISFTVNKGEFFGIVGRNGSGKSTLLKILAGIYQPTQGSITKTGKLVPFIELGVGFNPELTGRENVYLNGAMLGFSNTEIKNMYDDIVEFAELERFMDQKLKNYSSGMQVRLAFSMATRADADILLVDEVLAVGDADFQRKCFKFFKQLKKQGKTVVFVSHDMSAVRDYCDRGILIEKNEIIQSGRIDKVAGAYTKMFIENHSDSPNETTEQLIAKKRWGTGLVRFKSVSVTPANITGSTQEIAITCTFESKQDIENIILGFSFKNGAGTIMCGTNTKLLDTKVTVKSDKEQTVVWKLPNVFNDGEYSIDVAAISAEDETVQYDWWEDSTSLSVRREMHTSYVIEPKIEIAKIH